MTNAQIIRETAEEILFEEMFLVDFQLFVIIREMYKGRINFKRGKVPFNIDIFLEYLSTDERFVLLPRKESLGYIICLNTNCENDRYCPYCAIN